MNSVATLRIDPELRTLIPPLTEEEKRLLEESIVSEGCRDPLVVWGDVLIDGHNRYDICMRRDVPFRVVQREFADKHEAKDWIIRNQLGRRNLTPEQRSYLIGKQYQERKRAQGGTGANQYTREQTPQSEGTAQKIAAENKVSRATVERAAQFALAVDTIARNVGEEVREKILSREVPLTAKDVQKVARLEPEKQKAIIEKVLSGEAKSVVDARRLVKKETVKEVAPPSGKYRVIYADPPWSYGNKLVDGYGAAEDHYPTMTIEELCALPVKDLAEDNAVLFLWVTSPLLEECFEVIRAWGFKYKASFVWDKLRKNFGYYNGVRHEFLLVCTRGSCTPDVPKLFDSVQSIERTEHSRKPEEFRQIIDTLYPHGKRIELFARRPAPGWEVWGNEPGLAC
ncbi:MAG TPA: MT-A70 family methyltransferase [Methanothrix sp.]|nr:MT-A70 family methyltransferase [Methanothrix sp.]